MLFLKIYVERNISLFEWLIDKNLVKLNNLNSDIDFLNLKCEIFRYLDPHSNFSNKFYKDIISENLVIDYLNSLLISTEIKFDLYQLLTNIEIEIDELKVYISELLTVYEKEIKQLYEKDVIDDLIAKRISDGTLSRQLSEINQELVIKDIKIIVLLYTLHSAVLSGRWCGDQRPLCGPAAGECQSVEFGFITTV